MGTIALRLPGIVKVVGASRRRRPVRTINLIPWIMLILALTGGCLLYVQARTSVIRERYLLERAERALQRERLENKTLRLAWATLTSPKQLESKARNRLGLHHPGPEEVFRLP
jgi:cell division protein FtsL